MRSVPRRSSWLALLVTVAAAGPASAARLVPAEPTFATPPAPAIRARFQDAVARGAGGGPNEVVPPVDVRAKVEAQKLACKDADCWSKLATGLGADGVVVTQIEETGKRYGVQVRVYDNNGRELGKVVTEFCDICTVKEATDTVEKAVKEALLKVSFTPPKPPVAATTPGETEEGPDALRSTPAEPKAGEVPRKDSENEAPPKVAEPHEETTPPPQHRDEGGAEPSHFPYRTVAGIAFGVAGASLIATIVFAVYAAKESQPTCDLPDPVHACPNIYSGNTAPTAVFGALTAVAAVGGGLLLWLDGRARKHNVTAIAAPTPTGFAASLRLSF